MNFMQSVRTHSAEESQAYAQQFVEAIIDSYTEGGSALVVGLSGELGSGKTTFMKGVAKALGVNQTITSPTFVIEKIYPIGTNEHKRSTLSEASKLKDKPFKHLIHIDAYRLEEEKELLTLGWEELKRDPENFIFIEWPERVEGVLPKNIIKIEFAFINESTRDIVFK